MRPINLGDFSEPGSALDLVSYADRASLELDVYKNHYTFDVRVLTKPLPFSDNGIITTGFKFMGRMNEDITTYVNLGSKGNLFLTTPNISISQQPTQKEEGGLTDLYLEYGTYIKSFFSVMYNPSSVKVSSMGDKQRRIHHRVSWNNAVPKILNEKHKK